MCVRVTWATAVVFLALAARYDNTALAALPAGVLGDRLPSLIYAADTGRLSLEPGFGGVTVQIEIGSDTRLFLGPQPDYVIPPFDMFGPNKLYLLRINGVPDAMDFGPILPAGLSKELVLNDLTALGTSRGPSTAGFDLIYIVPEPNSILEPTACLMLLWLNSRRQLVHR